MTTSKDTNVEILSARVAELCISLKGKIDLRILAERSGGTHGVEKGHEEIHLTLFGRPVRITFPEINLSDAQTGEALSIPTQAILLYYLNAADGTPVEGRWISFADLPDGRFYQKAFQGYTGNVLAKHFGNDLGVFEQASRRLNGEKLGYGDSAFAFYALPRVMLAAVYHLGDGDFPGTCKILFDASTRHYLPTDVCAILGSMLTQKLVSVK